jgi:hypothetical protein
MIEPVQSLVVLLLEKSGYFVRSNVRYATPCPTPTGNTSAYGDLDIVAVKFDPVTGLITDRIWGEVKAHLTSSLTLGYLRGFLRDYSLMLDLQRAPVTDKQKEAFSLRQRQAYDTAASLLGATFRRVLYFGGKIPQDRSAASQYLHPDLEIVYVREFVRESIGGISHREGNNAVFRVVNMLSAYGLTNIPVPIEPT